MPRTRSAHETSIAATLLLVLVVSAAGCATFRPANAPLKHIDPDSGYRPERLIGERSIGDVAMVLAFSGGGTRAAALAYGVLLELRDTQIESGGETKRLLDEVDAISSVSGGSFTAAYYGLHGDGIFEDFEARFLKLDVERALLLRMLSPHNWIRLMTPLYDRSEMAIDYYDAKIFDDATFADLAAAGGPLIEINATDLSAGTRFTFTQPQFDLICSDLTPLHLARAVTASSAVPVVFSPIALTNYARKCDYERPAWLDDALASRMDSPRRYHIAKEMIYYLEAEAPHYLHLVDGGIADNLGVRGPLDSVIVEGGILKRLKDLDAARPQHLVFIVVDSSTDPDRTFVSLPGAPSLVAIMGSVTDTQLHRYNFETKDLLHESMQRWTRASAGGHAPMKVHMIDIAEYAIADEQDRAFFDKVPTSLSLDAETVDRLIAIGRRLLRDSVAYQGLLTDLGAAPVGEPTDR